LELGRSAVEVQGWRVMREVFTSQDFTQVGYYKSVLDEAGISSFVRNENANSIGLSGAIFFPSLCVTEDADYDEAIRILKSRQYKETTPVADWTCPSCSEKNPGNFELCWNCTTPRPGV
jgi:Putative prokaryotic signal transducing protein